MLQTEVEYISVGGNRQAAADWKGDVLAFGAGNNIALWNPNDPASRGIQKILTGHSDTVTAVKFLAEDFLISGSADRSIRAWKIKTYGDGNWKASSHIIGYHESSITAIAVYPNIPKIVSAGSDSVVKVWGTGTLTDRSSALIQSISLKIIPLAIAIYSLDPSSWILAIGGSHSSIQIHVSSAPDSNLVHSATLTGHSGWIRSLSFTRETTSSSSDIILASASQDKFVRLWRVHNGKDLPTSKRVDDPRLGDSGKLVSTKAHWFTAASIPYSITFEALLLGHEDWVYSSSWSQNDDKLQLLTSSADNSIAIWEPDPSTGIWLSTSRLGDISAEKGGTTATGSIGGFWNGLWSPDGRTVTSLGRTGSWRVWGLNVASGQWEPQLGSGGHVRTVADLAWSRGGGYILSTSMDQTTRLHARWIQKAGESWHEFARPQIHGYDLNCIDVISDELFISGADEKPLRVFQEPAIVADILQRLAGGPDPERQSALPDAANIPVLGLSNQAIQTLVVDEVVGAKDNTLGSTSVVNTSILKVDHPPLEDHLSKHLLWPETQKVYGHGYEVSAVAVSHDGKLVATACKASSIDHAVIRLYDTENWREHGKPLTAHTLTVTDLKWSLDDQYLLSVSRDRAWSVFKANQDDEHSLRQKMAKAHTRMILACSWASLDAGYIFVTAGRDKEVKVWKMSDQGTFELAAKASFESPVTAVAVFPSLVKDKIIISSGLETGALLFTTVSRDFIDVTSVPMNSKESPAKAVTKLAWRPLIGGGTKLAVASEDHTVRIVKVIFS